MMAFFGTKLTFSPKFGPNMKMKKKLAIFDNKNLSKGCTK